MVWLGFTIDRKLQFYMWDGKVKATNNLNAFENEIEPFFDEMGDETYSFYEDNAPVHNAHLTQNWLAERNIHAEKMPPYSPDLNPAEHAISMLCRLVYENGRQFLSIVQLKKAIKRAWLLVPQAGLNHAINSMPDRISAVIANGGGSTDY